MFHAGLVQLADPANFAQHGAAQLQAVIDLRGGAHVEQRAFDLGVLGLHIEPANLIRLVFLGCHPARGCAGGAALAQGKHAGPLRPGGKKGIGMQADKQVGLHALGFLHAHMEWHKKVGIAREKGAHGIAIDRRAVDAVAQLVRQAQHHIFLAGAPGANGTRVFATVAGVQRHDDQAVGGSGQCLGGLLGGAFFCIRLAFRTHGYGATRYRLRRVFRRDRQCLGGG